MSSCRSSSVVTGASSGIGRAAAVEPARPGFRVLVSARRGGNPETLVAEDAGDGQVVGHPADPTDPGQVATPFAAAEAGLGDVDVVMHSVGHDHGVARPGELSPEAVPAVVAAPVTSPAPVLRRGPCHHPRARWRGVARLQPGGISRHTRPCPLQRGRAGGGPGGGVGRRRGRRRGRFTIAVAGILPGRLDTPMQRRLVEAVRVAPQADRPARCTSMRQVPMPGDVSRAVRDLLHRPVHEPDGRILVPRSTGASPHGHHRSATGLMAPQRERCDVDERRSVG